MAAVAPFYEAHGNLVRAGGLEDQDEAYLRDLTRFSRQMVLARERKEDAGPSEEPPDEFDPNYEPQRGADDFMTLLRGNAAD